MADNEAIYAAIRKADAAGDGESVRKLAAYLQQQSPAPNIAQPPPVKSNSRLQGFIGGALKPLDNLAEAASNIPYIGHAIDRAGQALGMPSASQAATSNQAMRTNNSRAGYQTLGNIAGTLPTMALKGGQAVQGAVSGALLSDSDNPFGVALDAAMGAGGAVVGGKVLSGLSSLAKPVVTKGQRALQAAGIPMTIGQMAAGAKSIGGKIVSGGEEAMTSIPFVGQMVRGARDTGVLAYNKARHDIALKAVGKNVPKSVPAGQDMTDYVSQQLGNAYQRLVPKLSAQFDEPFLKGIVNAETKARELPPVRQDQLRSIMSGIFGNRTNDGGISQQALKDAETRLTQKIGAYRKSPDPDQKEIGRILSGIRDDFRSMLMRQNPRQAQQLQRLNQGWAELKTIEKAVGNDAEGLFTPKSFYRAAKSSGGVRRGSPNRDLTIAAARQLSNNLPNSGTADRAMAAFLVTGAAAPFVSPWLAVPAVGSLAYTKAGQKAVNAAWLAQRPSAVQATSRPLKALARATPQIIPPLLVARDQ